MLYKIELLYKCKEDSDGCGHMWNTTQWTNHSEKECVNGRPWLYTTKCSRCQTECSYLEYDITEFNQKSFGLMCAVPKCINRYSDIAHVYTEHWNQIFTHGSMSKSTNHDGLKIIGNRHVINGVVLGSYQRNDETVWLNTSLIAKKLVNDYIDECWLSIEPQFSIREVLLHELKHWFDHQTGYLDSNNVNYMSDYKGYVNSKIELSANIFTTVDILYSCLGKSVRELSAYREMVNRLSVSFKRIADIENYNNYISSLRNCWRKTVGTNIKFPIKIFQFLSGQIT